MARPFVEEQHKRAQRVLVGYLLGYPSAADELLSALPKDQAIAFTEPILRKVFETIHDLHDRGADVAEHTVASEFQRRGWKGSLPQVFVDCSDAATREFELRELGDHPLNYVAAVVDGYHLGLVQKKAQRATSFGEFLEVAEEAFALDAKCVGPESWATDIESVLDEVIETQEAINDGTRVPGYAWGIAELDAEMPLRTGKLYTIAAQKGSGKSKLLLAAIHHNVTKDHVPAFLLSLEMDRLEIGKLLLSRESECDSSIILGRKLPSEILDQIREARERLGAVPLEIDCSPSLSVNQIVSKIRHWKLKNKIPDHTGVVGIDFLQLITLDRMQGQVSEATAIKNVAYALARAAKTHQVCIIAVAQLNKQADDTTPRIGFIEGSGGPSQASHGVLLLDLPRLRGEGKTESDDGWDELNIIIAKNRDGESGVTVRAHADLSTGRFVGRDTARVLPFRRS